MFLTQKSSGLKIARLDHFRLQHSRWLWFGCNWDVPFQNERLETEPLRLQGAHGALCSLDHHQV